MFRYGILSTAKIGIEHLIPAMSIADNCVVTAIASRDLERAQALAKRFDVRLAFGSYEQMLASDEIDAVYIPLPTSQHVEWTRKAIEAGKHVLCEKPISLRAEEIRDLMAARDQHGVLVSEAFMVTYHPQWHKVRELIQEGKIGNLKHVQASFTYHNVDPDNMRNQVALGGGVIPDIAVYPVVATRFATQTEPNIVSASVDFDPEFKTDRYANVQLSFDNFDMSFYVSTQMALRQTIVFHGDKGFIELRAPFNSNLYDGDEVLLQDLNHKETRVFRYAGVNQYQLQVEAFARAAMGDDQKYFTLEDSYQNQRIIDAIYRSAELSEVVEI